LGYEDVDEVYYMVSGESFFNMNTQMGKKRRRLGPGMHVTSQEKSNMYPGILEMSHMSLFM
jgi:hypothetical protein